MEWGKRGPGDKSPGKPATPVTKGLEVRVVSMRAFGPPLLPHQHRPGEFFSSTFFAFLELELLGGSPEIVACLIYFWHFWKNGLC